MPLVKFLLKALKTLKANFKKYRISAQVLFYKEKTENSIIEKQKRVMFQHLHPQLKHVWVGCLDNGKIQYPVIYDDVVTFDEQDSNTVSSVILLEI